MSDEPQPRRFSRRDFLKAGAATLGGATLGGVAAALRGVGRPDAQPALAVTEPRGRQTVGRRDETVVAPEKPKQPRDAKLEDLLGEGYRRVAVIQGKGEEYPPQDVELGPGFFVTSKLEGVSMPVSQQEGAFYYFQGYEGEFAQGGTVTGEMFGATVIDSPDRIGKGASVMCGMGLGVAKDGRQALQLVVDNASNEYNEDFSVKRRNLDPERVVINVDGNGGRITHVVDKGGARGDVGYAYLIPLGGLQPEFPEGVDDRNVVEGVKDSYRGINRVTVSMLESQKNLTFNFEKKGKPEPKREG